MGIAVGSDGMILSSLKLFFFKRAVTFRRTRSAANSGSRSLCPSAQRYSIVTFRPVVSRAALQRKAPPRRGLGLRD
jgi:hypothetical protein